MGQPAKRPAGAGADTSGPHDQPAGRDDADVRRETRTASKAWIGAHTALLAAAALFVVAVTFDGPGHASAQVSPCPPLPSIEFFGQSFQAETIVWCIDLSVGMNFGSPSLLAVAKQQVIQGLSQLTPHTQFGVVGMHTSPVVNGLRYGTPANAMAVANWIQSQFPFQDACPGVGVQRTLELAGGAFQDEAIVLVATSTPEPCPNDPTAAALAAANLNGVPIHVFFLSSAPSPFWQQVAADSGGSFHAVEL